MSASIGNSELANTVTTIIASLLGGATSGVTEAVANQLYSEVSRRLRKSSKSVGVFSTLEANPKSVEAKKKFKRELLAEFESDEAFRKRISTIVDQDNSQTSTEQSAFGINNKQVGRDDNSKKTHVNFGGLMVAIVAIALVILLGSKAVNLVQSWSKDSVYGGLSGQSTCKEFLGADASAQTAIVKNYT